MIRQSGPCLIHVGFDIVPTIIFERSKTTSSKIVLEGLSGEDQDSIEKYVTQSSPLTGNCLRRGGAAALTGKQIDNLQGLARRVREMTGNKRSLAEADRLQNNNRPDISCSEKPIDFC
jgi:putative intracellular protease/amidase